MLRAVERFFQQHPRLTVSLLKKHHHTRLIQSFQRQKAVRIARLAATRVPAYQAFLEEHGFPVARAKRLTWHDWEHLPIMDKASYIRAYPLEHRCLDGRLPREGKIDESGGSSGRPTEWVHSLAEEERLLATVGLYREIWWPEADRIILVNALSCGPWSGGVTLTILLHHDMLVKTIGTDMQGVLRTLEQFGTRYQYIIVGYPLFLADLLDQPFPWKDYQIDFLTGGDPHSLAFQERVEKKTGGRLISAYGNSDIDVGIAIETPLTQALRKALREEKALREALSWYGEVPMLFQYDAFSILIEQEGHELVMTHLDPSKAQPAVRYNMHDEGKVISYPEMLRIVREHAPSLLSLFETAHLKLPFMTIDGRSDGTISLDGANVHPSELEDILFSEKRVNRFKLVRREKPPYFVILVELTPKAKPSERLARQLERKVQRELVRRNHDYAESLTANPHVAPRVVLIPHGSKAFRVEGRKYKWIIRDEHLKAYGIRIKP